MWPFPAYLLLQLWFMPSLLQEICTNATGHCLFICKTAAVMRSSHVQKSLHKSCAAVIVQKSYCRGRVQKSCCIVMCKSHVAIVMCKSHECLGTAVSLLCCIRDACRYLTAHCRLLCCISALVPQVHALLCANLKVHCSHTIADLLLC